MTIITPQAARGLALSRAAETMLRTLGGVEVSVRFASPTNASGAEFGLSTSSLNDIPIEPVIVRTADVALRPLGLANGLVPHPLVPHPREALRARVGDAGSNNFGSADPTFTPGPEFLFAASSVTLAALAAGYTSPIDWFAQSLGIVFNNTVYPIAIVTTENFAAQPYLYHVTTQ
jgi:hypothetical protein